MRRNVLVKALEDIALQGDTGDYVRTVMERSVDLTGLSSYPEHMREQMDQLVRQRDPEPWLRVLKHFCEHHECEMYFAVISFLELSKYEAIIFVEYFGAANASVNTSISKVPLEKLLRDGCTVDRVQLDSSSVALLLS